MTSKEQPSDSSEYQKAHREGIQYGLLVVGVGTFGAGIMVSMIGLDIDSKEIAVGGFGAAVTGVGILGINTLTSIVSAFVDDRPTNSESEKDQTDLNTGSL